MGLCSAVYFILTLLLESMGDKWSGCTTRKTAITSLRMHRNRNKRDVIDEDVAAEKERVRSGKGEWNSDCQIDHTSYLFSSFYVRHFLIPLHLYLPSFLIRSCSRCR